MKNSFESLFIKIIYGSPVSPKKKFKILSRYFLGGIIFKSLATLPTAEILSGKNARAFLVSGLFMKSFKKKYPENMKKIVGAVTCLIAQPIQPIFTQIGLDQLCYLASNF